MESNLKVEVPVLETTNRLSSLSIIVDDFDCDINSSTSSTSSEMMPEVSLYQPPPRPYTRQSSDAMIQKILEEAELRKHEFWKLIDEHNAVVENLKKMEQADTVPVCKISSTAVLRT